jgi:hypothetical protein
VPLPPEPALLPAAGPGTDLRAAVPPAAAQPGSLSPAFCSGRARVYDICILRCISNLFQRRKSSAQDFAPPAPPSPGPWAACDALFYKTVLPEIPRQANPSPARLPRPRILAPPFDRSARAEAGALA